MRIRRNRGMAALAVAGAATLAGASAHAAGVGIVNQDANVNLSNFTGTDNSVSESFSVGASANVLVVEMFTKFNANAGSGGTQPADTVTYGSSTLTLASGITSQEGTQRSLLIYYLANPAATGTVTATYTGATNPTPAGLGIYAFSLSNVDLTNLPTDTLIATPNDSVGNNGNLSAAQNGSTLNGNSGAVTLSAITGVNPGAMAVVAHIIGNTGTLGVPTESTDASVANSLYANNSTNGSSVQSVDFANLTGGSYQFAVTGDPGSTKELLAAAVFNPASAPVPEPASLGLIAIGSAGLLARRRR